MSLTLTELAQLLDDAKLRYRTKEDVLQLYFATDIYENRAADDCLVVYVGLEEDGEFIRVMSPGTYLLPTDASPETKEAVRRTLLQINFESKLHRYEYDQADGEIRLCADLPLEDAVPTSRQLARILRTFPSFADNWHLPIRDALDHAVALPGRAEIFRNFDALLKSLP